MPRLLHHVAFYLRPGLCCATFCGYDHSNTLEESPRFAEGESVYRVSHSGNDSRGVEVWRRQLVAGLPGFFRARRHQAPRDGGDRRRTSISTRSRWGAKDFRDAIARKTRSYLGIEIDPETEITVTCGSTEGMIAAMMATVDPGDEVIVFEPYYENYAPDAILSDAHPRYVPLRAPDWSFDRDELRATFNKKTKAIIVCNPNNPTGKVFTRDEMEFIAGLCQEFDALCFTDEIYEHILYPRDGAEIKHISMAQLDGMRDRTVVVNSMSKTYSVTGWRVGYCIASPEITSAVRKVHDF